MLAGILIGEAAGLAVAALCALCYTQGRKHGGGRKTQMGAAAEEEQNALMKKYETIMGYDPYGERV